MLKAIVILLASLLLVLSDSSPAFAAGGAFEPSGLDRTAFCAVALGNRDSAVDRGPMVACQRQ